MKVRRADKHQEEQRAVEATHPWVYTDYECIHAGIQTISSYAVWWDSKREEM